MIECFNQACIDPLYFGRCYDDDRVGVYVDGDLGLPQPLKVAGSLFIGNIHYEIRRKPRLKAVNGRLSRRWLLRLELVVLIWLRFSNGRRCDRLLNGLGAPRKLQW